MNFMMEAKVECKMCWKLKGESDRKKKVRTEWS